MISDGEFHSGLPNSRQRLLLNACVEPDLRRATALGERWLDGADLEHLDGGSRRMMGLLYYQLAEGSAGHPKMARLKAYFHRNWASNQSHLIQLVPVVESLERAGIPSLVLKGMPLAFSVYPHPGMRPMADSDLLVPCAAAEAAMDHLTKMGARRTDRPPVIPRGWDPGVVLRMNHGVNFILPRGDQLDLHWYSLEECCNRDIDDSFWARRVPFTAEGRRLNTLAIEDHLLHVCVHGLRADRAESSFRWLADATWLIRKRGDSIRWDLLVEEARRRMLSYTVAKALSILAETTGAAVPKEVPASLEAQVTTKLERWAFRGNLATSPRSKGATLWLRFVRMTPTYNRWQRLRKFPDFLRRRWTMESYGAIARHFVRKGLGRVG